MKWFGTVNIANCLFCLNNIGYNSFSIIDNKFPCCQYCLQKKGYMNRYQFIYTYDLFDPMDIDLF